MDEDIVIKKERFCWGNESFTLFQNILTEILCLMVGISYNYLSEVLYSTTNDLGTLMGDISFMYSLPLIISFFNIITVIMLILLTSAFQKYPLFTLALISLTGQMFIAIVITPSLPLIYDSGDSNSSIYEIIILAVCAMLHGIFSAFNFASFVHVSSLISPFHLILYIIGMNCGPLISSFLDYSGYILGGFANNWDYISMMLVLLFFEFISLVFMIFCYYYVKPFKEIIKIEPTSLVIKDGIELNWGQKTKILLASSFDEMKEVVTSLKHRVVSLSMVCLTSNILYPGLFMYYHITASNQENENNECYSFLMKNISMLYTGFCLVGSVLILLPWHFSKKTILSASVLRLLVVTTLITITSQGGMIVMEKFGNDSNPTIVDETRLLLFILMGLGAIVVGITQGYIMAISFVSMIKRAEERVATYVMLITISLMSFIGTILQIVLLISFSSIFDF